MSNTMSGPKGTWRMNFWRRAAKCFAFFYLMDGFWPEDTVRLREYPHTHAIASIVVCFALAYFTRKIAMAYPFYV